MEWTLDFVKERLSLSRFSPDLCLEKRKLPRLNCDLSAACRARRVGLIVAHS